MALRLDLADISTPFGITGAVIAVLSAVIAAVSFTVGAPGAEASTPRGGGYMIHWA